jgi:putative ABC transport system permease protein
VPLARGRHFTPEEDVPDASRVLIVTHGFWQRELGGRADVVGTKVTLNDNPWTVVGVLPEGYRSPFGDAAIYRPLRVAADGPCGRGCWTLRVVGRLRPGVTLEQAQADVAPIARRIAEQFPQTNAKTSAWLIPIREFLMGEVRPALLALLGAVLFVLLIACVNLANLLLAHGAGRARELAVRVAMGAGRERLVRQLLAESATLAALGGALGLAFGVWGVRLLRPLVPEELRDAYPITVDGTVVAFTAALALVAALLFGLGPALTSARHGVAGTLREGGRGASGGPRARRVREGLIVLETALALVLLVGAGLMMRSFVERQRVDTGYAQAGILFAGVNAPGARYPARGAATRAFYEQLLERLRRDPRVTGIALSNATPLQGGDGDISVTAEGKTYGTNEVPSTWVRVVTPDYLRVMGMRLAAGRGLADADRDGAPLVGLVSEAFARRHFGAESPLGRRLVTDAFVGGDSTITITVVGVVRDVKFDAPEASPKQELYLPYAQFALPQMTLVVRAAREPSAVVPAIRRELAQLDRAVPLSATDTIEERLAGAVAMPRLYALLFAAFAAAALALAAIGIYGVVAYAVERRTRELGVRLALGAEPRDVLRLVVGQGMAPVLGGAAIGVVGALAAARALRSLLFGVGAADPATLVAVTVFLAVTALAATVLPARRAMRVPPAMALREE